MHEVSAQDLLPLIDIGGLRTGNKSEKQKIASLIGAASRDVGFFRICNHGIEQDLIETTYRMAEQFFSLSDDEKNRYYIGHSPNHRGYVPFTEKGDYADEVFRNYEAFDMGLDLPADDPDFLAGNLVLGPNVWPDLPGFREVASSYYSRIAQLGNSICSLLEIFLRLPVGSITKNMTKPVSQLRFLHYVRSASAEDPRSVNMGAHTDYECLTLLHTRNEGLQVMTSDDAWIDVPVDSAAYVVNIGDMLEAWTNGLLRSTPHRVINRSPERYSMPYFVAANHDTEIRPFPQLVPNGSEALYQPFLAGAHLERMLMRDFPYLRKRIGRLDSGKHELDLNNPFESRIRGTMQ